MAGEKKHYIPAPVRAAVIILVSAIVLYSCVVVYLCIQERSVKSSLPPDEKYDAIIVLGAQVKPDGKLSVQLEWRLNTAYEAYARKKVPVVVCGAQGKNEPVTEAEAMKAYLSARGVSEEDILTDPDSFNTRQNLVNAAVLLEKYPAISRVLIVTSDYHVPRSLALAKDLGFDACGLGSPCKPEYWIKNHAREALAWCKYWGVKYFHLPLE